MNEENKEVKSPGANVKSTINNSVAKKQAGSIEEAMKAKVTVGVSTEDKENLKTPSEESQNFVIYFAIIQIFYSPFV